MTGSKRKRRPTVGNSIDDEDVSAEAGHKAENEESTSKLKADTEQGVDRDESGMKPVKLEQVSEENGTQNEDSDIKPEQPLWKRKKRKKKEFLVDEEEEAKPTYTRRTEKGGYSHTNLSKSRISKANKGNKPWNFGKRRSSADRAKIAAGVRARNRTILLQKLKHLGMTEEEYLIKKKEIKYLRERVRRAKLANGKHLDKKIEQKLQEAIDATNLKNIVLSDENGTNAKNTNKTGQETKSDSQNSEVKEESGEGNKEKEIGGIFSKEIIWRPFSFSENNSSYDQACPEGGPGGLICCSSCSIKFNKLLTRTSEDIETYRMNKEAEEVTETLNFLNEKKTVLKEAVNSAKMKVPPLPPPGSGRLGLRQDAASSSRMNNGNRRTNIKFENPESHGGWNLTSSIDLGFTGGFASV
ncbi:unnamed protein product [Pseudo-nitzschia multistriata]|uniref:Nuclease associated modular domain-containing protein n=1 Tax=Pseudo-nitzschia multistriata TaxID=183589 RepID=A0A448YUT5_9STRA|nr:unnamed protein product [Pseudo-nitzschia multistriata]